MYILYPAAHSWSPEIHYRVAEDPLEGYIKITDFDGVWWSEDERIVSYFGTARPGPEAIIYKIPGGPPAGINGLVREFERAHALMTRPQTSSYYDKRDTLLSANEIREIYKAYPDYLVAIKDVLTWLNLKTVNPDTMPNELEIQSKPINGDVIPHIDMEDYTQNLWTLFCTVAGDPGTIIHTANHRLVQLEPGEFGAWRSAGKDGTWHSAPPSGQRIIYKKFGVNFG